MRNARLLGALAVATLVTAVGTYAVVRHQEPPPTVTCRHLLESSEVESLPATVVSDLRHPVFDVDVDTLDLPTAEVVDDARHALQRQYGATAGPADALVCETSSRALLLVRQAEMPLERCYGSAAQCAGMPTERRTCAEFFSMAVPAEHTRELGCPDLG